VLAGDADASLGLAVTAEKLDLGFVPLGEETVRVLAAPDRREKAGVRALESAIGSSDSIDRLTGYER
jgi:putative molybdopterin biosynthesis protein